MTASRALRETDDRDQCVTVRVDWRAFEALLAARGDAPVPRISYLDGVMELTSPARTHESTAGLIGSLVEIWADLHGIVLETTKSWTLKSRRGQAGVEPDESWVVGDRPAAVRPDLALEVVHTHGGLDKLELYSRLGVREVWFWIDGQLSVHVLRGPKYVRATRSHLFRGLDLGELVRFAKHASPGRARQLYRAALERKRR